MLIIKNDCEGGDKRFNESELSNVGYDSKLVDGNSFWHYHQIF